MHGEGNIWTGKRCREKQLHGGINILAAGEDGCSEKLKKSLGALKIKAHISFVASRSARRGIWAQKKGPLNSQQSTRMSRTILGKSWPVRRQPGRPSLRTLIADNDAPILAHFSRSDIGLGMVPKIGYP